MTNPPSLTPTIPLSALSSHTTEQETGLGTLLTLWIAINLPSALRNSAVAANSDDRDYCQRQYLAVIKIIISVD